MQQGDCKSRRTETKTMSGDARSIHEVTDSLAKMTRKLLKLVGMVTRLPSLGLPAQQRPGAFVPGRQLAATIAWGLER